MRKGRKTRFFGILLSLAMLLGSVPVLAAEADVKKAPDRAANPSIADANEIINYVSPIVDAEGVEYYSSSDSSEDLEYRLKHCQEGTLFVCVEKEEERCTLAGYFWYEYEAEDYYAPFGSEDKAKYDEVYDACIEVLRSFKYATGEYYFEWDEEKQETVDPLWIALEAARNLAYSVYDRMGESDSWLWIVPDDTESVDEDVMWVRQSDWDAFNAAMEEVDAILGEVWDITRAQAQELTERYTNIFNTLNAAIENGDLTPATPETSGSTTQTPTSNSVVTATGTTTVAAAVEAIATTSSVKGVKSTVSGAYFIKKVNGVAILTPMADIVAGYGIGSGERLYAKVWDLDPKKSYMAKQVIDLAAASVGAEVGPGLNIELGKLSGGKYSLLSQDGSAITIRVGIPASFVQNGKTYAVVRVRPGGAVSILADQDTDIDTVTFTTTGGAGAYAIIRY